MGGERIMSLNENDVTTWQGPGITGEDTVSDDLAYSEGDRPNHGSDTVDTQVRTPAYTGTTTVDMVGGYSESGENTEDRSTGSGLFEDESMFSTDDDGTPSADDRIGAMSNDEDGGGGILK
jgi:hypothetical protein